MDAGDTVRMKSTRDIYVVACRHGSLVYLCSATPQSCYADEIVLEKEATPAERENTLRALAAGSGTGHRPQCARERLAQEGIV